MLGFVSARPRHPNLKSQRREWTQSPPAELTRLDIGHGLAVLDMWLLHNPMPELT